MGTPSLPNILPTGQLEDEAHMRKALCTILISAGDMMLEQSKADTDVIPATRTDTCRPIVIMNINLTGASASGGMRKLSRPRPGVQFLMHTMHADDQRVIDALQAGANGYLLKSAKPLAVVNALRDLLQSASPMGAPIARRVAAHPRPAQRGEHLAEAKLTHREREILELLAEGLLYKEISARINLSEGAIKQHIHRMYEKLHVQNRTEAVNRFFGR